MSEQPTKGAPVSTKELDVFSAFSTFGEAGLIQMRDASAQFLADYKANRAPRWLSLLGTSGAGKTMLARIIKQQIRGEFRKWATVIKWTREGDHRMFEDLAASRRCVVIDDIGSEYGTDYSRAKLYEFLGNREGKWTIITANLSLAQIGANLDTRIASRMLRGKSSVVDVSVTDFNLREQQQPKGNIDGQQ